MTERKTTIGFFNWQKEFRGNEELVADDPIAPEGEGWIMEGSGMYNGIFAWFWVRETNYSSYRDI